MRNNSYTKTDYKGAINSISLKQWHDYKNLVLDVENMHGKTWEDLLLGLDDIKDIAESRFGHIDNIDIRVH